MKFILNLLVIAVLGYTGYVGYKRGIVTSFIGLIAVILSVYIAFLVSNTYSEEFMGLVQPFAGGLVDTAITDTVETDYFGTGEEGDAAAGQTSEDTSGETSAEASGEASGETTDETGGELATDGGESAGEDSGDTSGETSGEETGSDSSESVAETEADGINILLDPVMTLTEEDKQDPYTVCVASLMRLGLADSAAEKIAQRVSAEVNTVGQRFIDAVTRELSLALCRVAIFTIAFILVAIIFVVIGNIININFGLPGLEKVNNIGGVAIGIVKGIIILMFVGCLMRYTGLLIPEEKVTGAFLFGIFVTRNFIASRVGI